MALFGSSDGDLQRRVDELERRVAQLEFAMRHAGIPNPPPKPGPLSPVEVWISAEVRDLAMRGKKIEAIKLLREQTGLTLKEAKDAVDAL